jgi:uncharacterized protein DUF3857
MKFNLLLFCLLAFNIGVSQKIDGKVTVKDLEETVHPLDAEASAAVLFSKYKITFDYNGKKGFSVEHTFKTRIKIYKKEGLQYADYEIPYYVGYENLIAETLSVSDAVTYNLENGKIEKTKLGSKGTFKEKVDNNWKTVTITMPNVKVGSIIEFSYTLKSENLTVFPTFFFQKEIPVNYAEYKTEIPAIYLYKPVIKGSLQIKSDAQVQLARKSFFNENRNSEVVEYNEIVTTHALGNVPALKEESFVDNPDNYRSSINYELELIRNTGGSDTNFAKTWEDVAKNIFKEKDFGSQVELKGYYDSELRPLIEGLNSDERIKAVYNFVQTKMNWNREFGIFADKGVQQAYISRTGNAAEINFILISMLNSAGIVTCPVLVSTLKNGLAIYPNRTAFNYVIAAANIDGKTILLDATTKNAKPGILPEYALNGDGRLIKKDGSSEEIDLSPDFKSQNGIVITAHVNTDGTVSGKAKVIKSEYNAMAFRNNYAGQDVGNYLQFLENKWGGIEISNYEVENKANTDKPIQEAFDFKATDVTENIGGKIYIDPQLFLEGSKNPFTQEKRSLPVFFGFPKQEKYMITLEIPEGFAVESMPESATYTTTEGVASFKCTFRKEGSKIQILTVSDINVMLVAASFYPAIKDFYQKISNKLNEKIVLKKV